MAQLKGKNQLEVRISDATAGRLALLVGGIPWYIYPSEKWWSSDQLGWWDSKYMEKQNHVPNHQPGINYNAAVTLQYTLNRKKESHLIYTGKH